MGSRCWAAAGRPLGGAAAAAGHAAADPVPPRACTPLRRDQILNLPLNLPPACSNSRELPPSPSAQCCSAARPKLSGPSGTVHPCLNRLRCPSSRQQPHLAAHPACGASGSREDACRWAFACWTCTVAGSCGQQRPGARRPSASLPPPPLPLLAGHTRSRARMDTAAAMQNLPADQQQQLMTAIEQMQVRDR